MSKFTCELISFLAVASVFAAMILVLKTQAPVASPASAEIPATKPPVAEAQRISVAVNVQKPDVSQVKEKAEPKRPLLGYKSEEFRKNFNEAGKKLNTGLSCGSLKFTDGSVNDAFNASIDDNLALIGSIDKATKQLLSVTLLAVPDGTQDGAYDMVLAIGQLIATAAPELDGEKRGLLLRDTGLFDSGLKDGSSGSYILGDRKFFYSVSSVVGIWFGVEAISE
jgi:hypothetical protein